MDLSQPGLGYDILTANDLLWKSFGDRLKWKKGGYTEYLTLPGTAEAVYF